MDIKNILILPVMANRNEIADFIGKSRSVIKIFVSFIIENKVEKVDLDGFLNISPL